MSNTRTSDIISTSDEERTPVRLNENAGQMSARPKHLRASVGEEWGRDPVIAKACWVSPQERVEA